MIHIERPRNTNSENDQCRGSRVGFPFGYRREAETVVDVFGVDESDEQVDDIGEEHLRLFVSD